MSTSAKRAVATYRRGLKQRGMVRLEVHVPRDDASLVRSVVKALGDPRQQAETRALLRQRFQGGHEVDLKALLASAPLEGIDLTRDRGFDRDVDL
jgi:hypothetical protein